MLALVRKELHGLNMVGTPHLNERRQTILVVEDEAAIRNVLHIILRRMGHTVLEACDGAEGLTVSQKFNGPIDLLIADVRMPKVDGPTLAHQLQAERPGIQVLLMSGYSTGSVPNDLIKDFLHKPFLPVAFEQKVREMLARDEGISTERGLRLRSAPVRSASANNPGRGTA